MSRSRHMIVMWPLYMPSNGQRLCAPCGQFYHDSKEYKWDTTCYNCRGTDYAQSQECPKWKLEKEVQQVKVSDFSFFEVRTIVEPASPAAAEKTYAAAASILNLWSGARQTWRGWSGKNHPGSTPGPNKTNQSKEKDTINNDQDKCLLWVHLVLGCQAPAPKKKLARKIVLQDDWRRSNGSWSRLAMPSTF